MDALSSPDGARYGSWCSPGPPADLAPQARPSRHSCPCGPAAFVQQYASRTILTPDVTVNPTSWEIRVQACLMIPSALAVPLP